MSGASDLAGSWSRGRSSGSRSTILSRKPSWPGRFLNGTFYSKANRAETRTTWASDSAGEDATAAASAVGSIRPGPVAPILRRPSIHIRRRCRRSIPWRSTPATALRSAIVRASRWCSASPSRMPSSWPLLPW